MSSRANFFASAKQFWERGGFGSLTPEAIVGRKWYVDTINGGGNGKLPGTGAFKTMAQAFAAIDSHDIIAISGVVREQLTAPLGVFDITIVGAGNTPRQATSGGVPTGGGSTWLAPASGAAATTPLLTLLEQGWRLENFFMNNTEEDASCVTLERRETAAIPDSSHASFYGMVFGGGLYGIEAIETAFVKVAGCRFQNFSGASDFAIHSSAGDGIAVPLQWEIKHNIFRNNKNHVQVPISQGEIIGNDFGIVGNSVTTVIACKLDGGGLNNTVSRNYLNRPLNASPNATLYVGGANDLWYENFGTDGIFYGVPDNS